MALLYLQRGEHVESAGLCILSAAFTLIGVTRILQLKGRLRDPAP
jgi:hypothetical protein